ncbi:MAG: LacI family DNA-binding transcriptional regulator [Chloroflexi bacterium]|nr:LacI family DNA-binding transcriptional regulator [Chloroflexota bacterium]
MAVDNESAKDGDANGRGPYNGAADGRRDEKAPAGGRPVTIRHVASAAGVSPMTVSRVLNGRGYVAPATAARVRAVFGELDYRPNAAARLLRTRRSGLIGVTLPSLSSDIHRGIVSGVEEAVTAESYHLVLGHLRYGSQSSSTFLRSLQHRCDGYVIVPSRMDPGAADSLSASLPGPAVVTLSPVPGVVADEVVVDGAALMEEATARLIERFGGPVAFVGVDSPVLHDTALLAAYRRAVRAAGLRESVLLVTPSDDSCRRGVRALLAGPEPPRAFALASAIIVFDVLGEMARAGLAVGRDVGVAALTSEERPWTALLPHPILLLCLPAREIGRRAGSLLVRRLRGELTSTHERIVVPMRLCSSDGRDDLPALRPARGDAADGRHWQARG